MKGQFPKPIKRTMSRSFLEACLNLRNMVECRNRRTTSLCDTAEKSRQLYVIAKKKEILSHRREESNNQSYTMTASLYVDNSRSRLYKYNETVASSVRSRSVSFGTGQMACVRFHNVDKTHPRTVGTEEFSFSPYHLKVRL